jgi:hypothetical protein
MAPRQVYSAETQAIFDATKAALLKVGKAIKAKEPNLDDLRELVNIIESETGNMHAATCLQFAVRDRDNAPMVSVWLQKAYDSLLDKLPKELRPPTRTITVPV